MGYLTRVIHISRKEESKVVVVVVVVVVKEETSYRCEKISRKEEGRRAGRGYLYPANRAKFCANPNSVRAREIEVNEQMGLQHFCQKLPLRLQQSWQHLRGPSVREMRLDLIRSRTGNAH